MKRTGWILLSCIALLSVAAVLAQPEPAPAPAPAPAPGAEPAPAADPLPMEPVAICRLIPQCSTNADCDAQCGAGLGKCVHSKCPIRVCRCS
jgi:hypothetical protein